MRTRNRTIERFIQLTWLVVTVQLCLQPAVLARGSINQEQTEARKLEPGRMVEREIAGGQSHTYQISLTAGQFVRVVVEQRIIGIALKFAAPDGKQLLEVDVTSAGELESLSSEAATSGAHQLTISGNGAPTPVGSYRVQLEVKAAASAQDKQRLTAERLLTEAVKSNEQGAKALEPTIEKARQALALWRELGDRYWEAATASFIGQNSVRAGKYEQAIEPLNQALVIRREIKDRLGEGFVLYYLAEAYAYLSRFEATVELSEQALAIFREVKDRLSEGSALSQLAGAHRSLSRFEKAVDYWEQSLAIIREVKERRIEGVVLGNLAAGNYGLNRFEKAIEYMEQSLVIRREVKDRRGEGTVLGNLGVAYGSLGRYEKAIEYYEQALAIHREVKNRRLEGYALNGLGVASGYLGHHEKAIEYYEQALAVHREMTNRVEEGNTLHTLGNSNDQLARREKAIEYFERALAIFREVKDRRFEGLTLSSLGNTYRGLSRHEKAIEYYQQAVAIFREIQTRHELSVALYGLARVEHARSNLDTARTYIEEGLKLGEATRAGLGTPESRTSFLASVQPSYRLYTDILMGQHKAEPTRGFDALAVEISERQRARSLLDLLGESRADLRSGLDVALIERERDLGRQLTDKARRLTQSGKPEQTAALKQEISQLENDYERAQAAIRKASPRYAALVQPQPLKLTEIQAQLDADSLLLEYSLGEERSYLWAITKDSLTSYELPKGELIEKKARQVYELLTARSINNRGETALQRGERVTQAETALVAAAQSLSEMLLAPAAAELGNKRLVIVADGALQYIPFAMLPKPSVVSGQLSVAKNNGPRTTDNGQPLIVTNEVISLPSASALAIQRAELAGRKPAPKLLAVIADPVFDRSDSRFTTPATETGDNTQTQTIAVDDARSIEHLTEKSSDKSGVTTLRLVIPRLPFTRREANQLIALAPKGSSFSAIDFQASRATALNPALSQYRYVHIATHGLLDTERPGLSALVFSMVDADGKPQNGFLRANDIYNLKLPAELVVLSACQTGLGKDIKGEGLVGLTRGFMYAGAARVVVSLWNVNDKATADLMTKFYEKMLKQGAPPAAALRAAQVEMWKQKQWQSPYYWAAFTMQGEWR